MPEQPGAGRLDPETLAAYIDGLLPPEERARVDAEIAADPETYEWLVTSIGAVDDPAVATAKEPMRDVGSSPKPNPAASPDSAHADGSGGGRKVLPFYRRRGVQGLFSTLLATAAALVMVVRTQPVWWQDLLGRSVDPRFTKLVEAVGEERHIEARLTGGFKYGPLRQVQRGPGDLSSQNLQLLAAAGAAQEAAEQNPSAATLHVWGVAQVLIADYDGAVRALEAATQADPELAEAYSDLAAVLTARASIRGVNSDWPRAISAAEMAIRLDPRSTVPLFNKALALEGLSLDSEARIAWNDFLEREQDESWRGEALRHLRDLSKTSESREEYERLSTATARLDRDAARAFAKRFPRAAREFVEDTALPAWGGDRSDDRSTGEGWLSVAVTVRDSLTNSASREWLSQRIEAASTGQGKARMLLAEAESIFGMARRAFLDARYKDSRPLFQRVAHLASASSPTLALAAEMHVAATFYYEGQLERSSEELARVAGAAVGCACLPIQARSHWLLGIISGAQARFSDSVRHYQLSRSTYEGLGESDLVATADQLTADAYSALGDFEQAWTLLRKAYRHWADDWFPQRQVNALLIGQLAARRAGLPETVLFYQSAVERFTETWPEPTASVEALADAARAYLQTNRPAEASAAIERGRKYLARIRDPGLRRQVETRLLRAEAAVIGVAHGEDAVARLTAAAATYESTGAPLPLVEVYWNLALNLERLGRSVEATSALERGVALVERQRSAPPSPALRVSYFDTTWQLYRELVSQYLRQGRREDALRVAELGRSRTLGDARGQPSVSPTLAADIQAVLGSSEAAVFYCDLPDRVAVWLLRRGSMSVVDLPRAALQLARQIEAAAETGSSEFHTSLGQTYEALWRPLEQALSGVSRVYVVPDGVLAAVPYSALFDTRSSRFLGESLTVSLLPGLRFLPSARKSPEGHGEILVVAASAASGSLPALPGAEREALGVAAVYGVRPRIDELAADGFREAAEHAAIIHFAGHAVANPDSPSLSRLILQGSGAGQGELYPPAIERIKMQYSPVVVLSACSSAAGSSRFGEGVLSLARPFMLGGARAVVASLWPVPDAEAAGVMVALHEALARGGSAAEALASAQRRFISAGSGSRTRVWASFVVFDAGGVS